jgi:hypothetical protein
MKMRILILIATVFLIYNLPLTAYEWQHIGPTGYSVLSIAVDPDDADRIIAGTDSGLYVSPNGGDNWFNRISTNIEFPDVRWAPLATDTILCLAGGGSYSDGLYLSDDGGNSWNTVAYHLNPRRMGFDCTEPGFMYICFSDGIIKSQNYGQTSGPCNTGLPGTDIQDVTGDGAHSLEAYAAGSNFMAHTSNFGNTWSEMPGTFNVPDNYPKRVIFDPNSPETIYVACDKFVTHSVNGGATWNYTSMPEPGIDAIVCHPDIPGEIYVGSDSGGVYKSVDAGASFIEINGNIGNMHIHSLIIDRNGYLLAGTDNGIYIVELSTVSIDNELPPLAQSFSLAQNYPNPFNNHTLISFTVEDPHRTKVEIFNIAGQLVKTLYDGYGSHDLIWDGTNDQGRAVTSGVYFCRLSCDNRSEYRRMTLLK